MYAEKIVLTYHNPGSLVRLSERCDYQKDKTNDTPYKLPTPSWIS